MTERRRATRRGWCSGPRPGGAESDLETHYPSMLSNRGTGPALAVSRVACGLRVCVPTPAAALVSRASPLAPCPTSFYTLTSRY